VSSAGLDIYRASATVIFGCGETTVKADCGRAISVAASSCDAVLVAVHNVPRYGNRASISHRIVAGRTSRLTTVTPDHVQASLDAKGRGSP